MLIDRKFKPELVASTDITRVNLVHPWLDKDSKTVSASNGFALVVVPVSEVDRDTGGAITVDALKAARKATSKAHSEAAIEANGALCTLDGTKYPRPVIKAPPVSALLSAAPRPNGEGTITLSFDAELLVKIAEAIGAGKATKIVQLTAYVGKDKDREPLTVTIGGRCGYREPIGLLMPSRK